MSYKMPIPTEAEEQKALFEWAAYNIKRYPALELLIHISNEGKRSLWAGRELKAQGLKPGVPDIVLPVPNRHHIALWIEMKRRKDGRVSEAQKRMMFALKKYGNMAVVCYGWEEARDTILNYLRQ
jgi:hypothetical protein